MHHRPRYSDDVTQPDKTLQNPYEVPYHYNNGDWIPLQGGKRRRKNKLDDFYRPMLLEPTERQWQRKRRPEKHMLHERTDFYGGRDYISHPELTGKRTIRNSRLSAIDELEIHESKTPDYNKDFYSTGDFELDRMSLARSNLSSVYSTNELPPFGKPIPTDTRLDPFGAPLEPQPVDDENDPLTWTRKRKLIPLLLISLMSFLAQFLAVSVAPTLWPLHYYFSINFSDTAYTIAAYISLIGVTPYLWNPLANRYGRRPILLISLVGTALAAVISGVSSSYALLVFARSVNGLFAAIPIGLGSVIVCDLFFQHERGLYVGIYMVIQATGIPFGALLGGSIVNWHWSFYLPAILTGFLLAAVWSLMPETYYARHVERLKRPNMSIFQQEFIRKKLLSCRKLQVGTFLRPLKMFKYPSIIIPMIYYSVVSAYGSFIFIITSGVKFHYTYGFHTWQTGVLLGVPLMLGSWIGEFGAGGFCDWVTKRGAISRGGKRVAEDRLYAMLPGVILAPLGLGIEGYCLQHHSHWLGVGLAIAIASAGLQIVTTVTYAYTAECYPHQVAETAILLNFGRQLFSFFLGFYMYSFVIKHSIQTAWLVFAGVELACFIPVLALMIRGRQWRETFAGPVWNQEDS